jgi:uncharacterized small protein (DUF1192 family)
MTIENLIANVDALTARVVALETEVAALKATKAPKAPKTSAAKADADTLYKVREGAKCPVKADSLYGKIWGHLASLPSFKRADIEAGIATMCASGALVSKQSPADLAQATWSWGALKKELEVVVPAATTAPVLDLPQEPAAAPVAEDKAPAEVIDLAGERPTEPAADATKKGKNKPRVLAS